MNKKEKNNSKKKKNRIYLVCVSGASGSGKTTFVHKVAKKLLMKDHIKSTILSLDNYYHDLSHLPAEERKQTNFDHPNALNWGLLLEHLKELMKGKTIRSPFYDFATHSQNSDKAFLVKPEEIIFLEGIHSMHHEKIRNISDILIFVQTDPDTCICRRIIRDTQERERTLEFVIYQYEKTVKPMFEKYIHPMMKYADVIIPKGGKNEISVGIIKEALKKLEQIIEHSERT